MGIKPIIWKTSISDGQRSEWYYYILLLTLFFCVAEDLHLDNLLFLYVHRYLGGRKVGDVSIPIISEIAFKWKIPALDLHA